MPNPLVKWAKRNTIQKVYIYTRVTTPTGCPSAEQILADVCKALSDSQGSFAHLCQR